MYLFGYPRLSVVPKIILNRWPLPVESWLSIYGSRKFEMPGGRHNRSDPITVNRILQGRRSRIISLWTTTPRARYSPAF